MLIQCSILRASFNLFYKEHAQCAFSKYRIYCWFLNMISQIISSNKCKQRLVKESPLESFIASFLSHVLHQSTRRMITTSKSWRHKKNLLRISQVYQRIEKKAWRIVWTDLQISEASLLRLNPKTPEILMRIDIIKIYKV